MLSAFHIKKVEIIDATDFSNVAKKVACDLRKIGEEVSKDYLERGILALKQYYAIALFDPANYHAVSEKVDPFWHAHILHTKEYIHFSEQVAGSYMHHEPLDHSNLPEVKKVRCLYEYSLECYRQFFSSYDKEFTPDYLSDEELMCTHGYILSSFALLPRNEKLHLMMAH